MNKVRWIKLVTRPMTGLTIDFFESGLAQEMSKLTGINLDVKTECLNGIGTVFEGAESRQELNEEFKRVYKMGPAFLKNHIILGKRRFRKLIKTSRNISDTDLRVGNDRLIKYFKLFKNDFYKYAPFLHTVFSPEAVLTEELKNKLKRKFPKDSEKKREEYFRILTTTQEDSDFYLEEKSFLEIAVQKSKGRAFSISLKRHTKRFGYMGLTNSLLSKSYDISHFKNLIGELRDPEEEFKRLENGRKLEKRKYHQFIKSLPAEILGMAEVLQKYILFRNDRITGLKLGQHNIKPLLREIGRRHKIRFEEIVYYRVEEIENLLKSGIKADISRRKKYFSVQLINGHLYYSEEPVGLEVSEDVSELRGMVAQAGNVKGRVRLVFSVKEASKVRDGDILVTTMTTPDFVSAMTRAGAIVTDEGGVLSHAAIVSREFGVPCVIGTQVATKVLKDGDLVEVDAELGIVRKLADGQIAS